MDQQDLYRDIAERTDGDIYIGVVGPVRTGKSAFIKRFMELLVLPNIAGEHRRERCMEELPISGAGRTIMTTQPKFVPGTAAEIKLRDQSEVRVRLVDCVGYLIDGALGTREGEDARMVRTPWFDHDIPFEEAAETGTRRVIAEHSTLGLVVTTDGTVADLPRAAYEDAEARVVGELAALGKPFAVLLNSREPDAAEAIALSEELRLKYNVPVERADVTKLTLPDIHRLLETLLYEFPLTEARLTLPGWVRALADGHPLKTSILDLVREAGHDMRRVRDHARLTEVFASHPEIGIAAPASVRLNEGVAEYALALRDGLFLETLAEATGEKVDNEEGLMTLLTEMAQAKREYDRVAGALESVRRTGYGMVAPDQSELKLETPEIVKQGGRFGVRLKAAAPSIHMIEVDIQTEVSPIVGTEKQSEELVQYLLSEFESDPARIWSTNIFGKSLNELVREGLAGKLTHMPDDVRGKIQETLSKIINEGNGGIICILL